MVMSCGDHPYDVDELANDNTRMPLLKWDREHWQAFRDTLEAVRGELMRTDATLVWHGGMDLQENPTMNDNLADSLSFTKKFKILLDCIDINKAIAPIRFAVDQQIKAGKMGDIRKIPERDVMEVYNYMKKMGDGMCRNAVESLFRPKPAMAISNQANDYELEDLPILTPILDDKPFNLFYVQDKIESVIRKWSVQVFGEEDPVLFKCRYGIAGGTVLSVVAGTPQLARRASQAGRVLSRPTSLRKTNDFSALNKSAEELAALQDGRDALKHNHGEDPLEESLTYADLAKVKARRRRSDYDEDEDEMPKKRLRIEDALEEDDEEDEIERAKLSELPRRKKRSISTPRRFDGPTPDDGIYNDEGLVVRRRRWTDEEKGAVKEGVKKFGVGHWVEIKKDYGEILRNRTSVQIKDVWRTMTKNGEV